MAAKSWLIDTAKSMIVINPKDFPMGLGAQPREDWPTESVGVMLYEAKNVMPTPFGYKSSFDQSQRFQVGLLTDKKVQDMFCYQTADLRQILVALCEDGIYLANATTGSATAWTRIVDLSAGEVAGVRRLWTRATIGNRVFLYQQGQPKIWALVTPDVYAEAATPSPITDATRTQVWADWNMGMVSYVPNFINMAGQIGIFRADNRLGMWDSANAVAWSSANYIEDFKPNAQTFAGVTTFTDVQGRIVKILGSGDAFVIYATASIVYCSSLQGTPEKWRGSAIASDIGVSFDIQVVAAQPDTTQFALTSSGLMYIKDAQFQYILPEVTDYLAGENEVLALSMIEGRHLFIHCANVFPGSRYGVESRILKDFNNNEYKFPTPIGGSPEDGFGDLLDDYISGANETLQNAFKDYEPIPDVPALPTSDTLLEPCYNIKTFESTWADTTFAPNPTTSELLDSKLTLGVTYLLEDYITAPVVTVNSISTDSNAPGDWAGNQIAEKLDLGMNKFNAQIAYQNAWIAENVADIPVNKQASGPQPPEWDGINPLTAVWDDVFIDKYELPNCLDLADLKVKANECRVRLYADKDRLLYISARFSGTETYNSGNLWGFFSGYFTNAIPSSGFPATTLAKCAVRVPYTAALEAEFKAAWKTTYGVAFYTQVKQLVSGSYYEAEFRYVCWAVAKFPDQCQFSGISKGEFLANLASSVSAFPAGGAYSYQATSQFPIYDSRLAWEIKTGATWNFNPANPYRFDIPSGASSSDPYGWGPYTGTTTKYYSVYVLQATSPTYVWTNFDKLSFIQTAGSNGNGYYELVGTITKTIDLLPNFSTEFIVYEAELSGWGYTPKGGFSFRKTHRRHFSTTCPMPTSAYSYKPSTPDPVVVPNEGSDGGKLNPPYKWTYPDAIPFPDNFVLYQQGSLAPYYPLYAGAVVYDSLLEKFGVYNEPHYLVYETLPVNRSDNTVMPVVDIGMYAGCLDVAKAATVFTPNTPKAMATWGKIGYYRLGMTHMYEARAYFKEKSYGHLIVEVSMDGIAIDPSLTLAVTFNGESSAFLPFTACGKWFNIRVEGQFNLNTLQVNSESAGRR